MSLQDLLDVVPSGSEELSLLRSIDFARLPRHVAIIMDGNGRWAKLRHKREVSTLMGLLKRYLRMELDTLLKNNIRFQVIGRMGDLPRDVQEELQRGIERTRDRTGLLFNIALNYGGRAEITDAVRALVADTVRTGRDPSTIDEHDLAAHLYTAGQPDPDLLIRTSGELRISNFLLWQIAYAEIWVTDVLWPDFRRRHLLQAIADYQKRERRYGGITPV